MAASCTPDSDPGSSAARSWYLAIKRFDTAAAALLVTGWYGLVYVVVRPLADAPVVDSWIYQHAVELVRRTGEIGFVGYTQAMPLTQVLYGALWSRLFGASYVSMDLSVAFLGAGGAVLFYALSRSCGAQRGSALLASGLLVANPCYLFLSFSFMTEVPFLACLIAGHYAFAAAQQRNETRRMWACAALTVLAFLVRPFALAAVAGYICAVLIFAGPAESEAGDGSTRRWKLAAPFAAALALCAMGWVWATVLSPEPWMLQRSIGRLAYVFQVPAVTYLGAGLLGPMLYLGVVMSPLALVLLPGRRWRQGLALAGAMLGAALLCNWLGAGLPEMPELSCFGGWRNALVLRGLSPRFSWSGWERWPMLVLASLGSAGLILAAAGLRRRITRASTAVLLTAVFYWCGSIPLWLFNDRYYLLLVPAACLVLALSPPPAPAMRAAAVLALALLGLVSTAGVYDHQRGLEAVLEAMNSLERQGVPRADIDAGYPLNGRDLYHYSAASVCCQERAPEIPMVTSKRMLDYAIVAAPIEGTRIVGRLSWPGTLGFGRRALYLVRKLPSAPLVARALTARAVRPPKVAARFARPRGVVRSGPLRRPAVPRRPLSSKPT